MPKSRLKPALFFDFDNTLTRGDVLDELIETYSPNDAWREWERAWAQGQLSARDCLALQVENMRVPRAVLLGRLSRIRVDPAFRRIVDWARARRVEVNIVSDSFLPLIRHILLSNGIEGVPIFANDLSFGDDGRLVPSFPFYDPASACSANAKSRHLAPYRRNRIVFAGDGRSDLEAALAADLVFAKSTLAKELQARRVAFLPFDTIDPVLAFLESLHQPLRERAAGGRPVALSAKPSGW